ncbi:peptidyl-tRNA hydrolase PTH2-domain-containing protein [Elsinoe ampelina]|uniref:peptidyl-tRNA hydrolase n=1 Tax=Elsinoe ampelina TaxID=302913 RepID=A0A6A6GGG5_9PEZI|nr:peptidyl-tRNA hydrolase PTH2-domain-containing protein [Elsinoe ampelina]
MPSSAVEKPPPSVWAVAFATAIITGLAGYFLGQASSIGIFGGTSSRPARKAKESDSESSDLEDDEDRQDELMGFSEKNEPCKLVLVVRTDLGMTKGKIAAQCGHATLACYKTLLNDSSASTILQRWERYGQAKIAVQVKSEEELEILQAQAVSLGICARIIHDAGRTQIASGSATVLGVGPAPESMVNQVTGGLKLL